MERKSYRLIILLLAVALLGGCVGDFAIFTYEAEMEFENAGVVDSEPIIDAEGNEVPSEYTIPIGVTTGVPAVDIVTTIINNAGAVEAAKFLTAAIAGDPASIASLRASGFKKVKVIKKVLPIRGRKFQEAITGNEKTEQKEQ